MSDHCHVPPFSPFVLVPAMTMLRTAMAMQSRPTCWHADWQQVRERRQQTAQTTPSVEPAGKGREEERRVKAV